MNVIQALILVFFISATICCCGCVQDDTNPDTSGSEEKKLMAASIAEPDFDLLNESEQPGPSVMSPPVILADPLVYTPAMSSTPGIKLSIVTANDPRPDIFSYHWKTDYGLFLSWTTTTGTVTEKGDDIITPLPVMYWTYRHDDNENYINRTVKIQASVAETEPASDEQIQQSDIALLEIYISEDGMARVKPAFFSDVNSEIIPVNSSLD